MHITSKKVTKKWNFKHFLKKKFLFPEKKKLTGVLRDVLGVSKKNFMQIGVRPLYRTFTQVSTVKWVGLDSILVPDPDPGSEGAPPEKYCAGERDEQNPASPGCPGTNPNTELDLDSDLATVEDESVGDDSSPAQPERREGRSRRSAPEEGFIETFDRSE